MRTPVACPLILSLLLSACGGTSDEPPKGCLKIGVLFPESFPDGRWARVDLPGLMAAIPAMLPGAQLDIQSVDFDADAQLAQADAMLAAGACILVVTAVDSDAAAAIVQHANAKHVPVIAYDRPINDPGVAFYVSFDNVAVGRLQGTFIADNYQDYVTTGHANLVLIHGWDGDGNAILFHDGAHETLDPLIAAGTLTSVYETYTMFWAPEEAYTEMMGALAAHADDIQIAYVANDGMAGAVIDVLTEKGLNGQVLVTGQDADPDAIRRILVGDQAMTVYKRIPLEVDATAQLVAALSKGLPTSGIATKTIMNGELATPAVLLDGAVVTKANVMSTVIADGFVSQSEVCEGIPPGTDTGGVCN